jgi:hypothetical protein
MSLHTRTKQTIRRATPTSRPDVGLKKGKRGKRRSRRGRRRGRTIGLAAHHMTTNPATTSTMNNHRCRRK